MSKAFQCDRCGEFFSPSQIKEKEKFTTIHGYGSQTAYDYRVNQCWDSQIEDVHLCPGCSKDFKYFMSGGNPDDETEQDSDSCCTGPIPSIHHNIDKYTSGNPNNPFFVDSTDPLAQWTERSKEDSEH